MKLFSTIILFIIFSSCDRGDTNVVFQYQLVDYISNLPVPDYELYLKIKDSEIEMKFRTDQDGIFEITQSADEVFYDLNQFFEIRQEQGIYSFSRSLISIDKYETPEKIIVYPKTWLKFSLENNQNYNFYSIAAFEANKDFPNQLFFRYPLGTWIVGGPIELGYYTGGYTPKVDLVEIQTTFFEKTSGSKLIIKDTIEFKSLDTSCLKITLP